MSQYLTQWSKKVVATATLLAVFSSFSIPVAGAVAPIILNPSVSSTRINTALREKTLLHFELNTNANVSIDVRKGNTSVQDILITTDLTSDSLGYNFSWDGTDNDRKKVSPGIYNIWIYVFSGRESTLWTSPDIMVESTEPLPVISDVTLSRSGVFNPDNAEQVRLSFNLDMSAYVTVDVFEDGTSRLIRTLEYNVSRESGLNFLGWDGRGPNGERLSAGKYVFRIQASKTSGGATRVQNSTAVEVKYADPTPFFTSISFTPSSLNPDRGDYVTLSYAVNVPAYVKVEIRAGGTGAHVATLTSSDYRLVSPLSDSVRWYGANSAGVKVTAGNYFFNLSVSKTLGGEAISSSTRGTETFSLTRDPIVDELPTISNVRLSPYSRFNPDSSEEVAVLYYLNMPAYVTVDVLEEGTLRLIRTLTPTGYYFPRADLGSFYWNGRGNSSERLSAGNYIFRIRASKTPGGATRMQTSPSVEINYGSTPGIAVKVSDLRASMTPFNPNNQSTTLYYTLDRSADYVNIDIKDDGGRFIRTLTGTRAAGVNNISWDGRYLSGGVVNEGTYTFRVTAGNTYGSDSKAEFVVVNYGSLPGAAVKVSDLRASLSPFNPNTQDSTLYYTLDRAADYVSIEIKDGNGALVRTFTGTRAANVNNVSWNGRNASGSVVSEGTYTFRVTAGNSYGSDTKTGFVVVNYGTSGSVPVISSLSAVPATFNPNIENSTLSYTLDRPATVTFQIIQSGSTVVRTLETNSSRGSGTNNVIWNGRDNNNNVVSQGYYTFRIVASNTYGSDARNGSVNVSYSDVSAGTILRNLFVNPEVFDPGRGASSSVYFNLDKAANVTTEVLDTNGNVIRTLVDNVYRNPASTPPYSTSFGSYNYSDSWNGRDRHGNIVNDNVFQFRVRAYTSSGESDTRTAYVEVDADGIIIGFPKSVNCVGFRDVTRFSPYCEAIKVMKDDGVFAGYADGTFRPYQSINRSETTKVVLLALRTAPVVDSGSVGFSDVGSNVWYAPYLRTAKRLGIIRGYPDGTFRPMQTVNRVELLKIFLESVTARVGYCNTAPYGDTPVNASTRWYIDYVCYAKSNNLMRDDGNGRFNPAAPMSRGDVADLFYQYENKGLYTGIGTTSYSRY